MRKISPLPRFDPRTVQPVATELPGPRYLISRSYKSYRPAVNEISYKGNPRECTNFTVRVFTANQAGNKIRQNFQYGISQIFYTSGEAVHVGFEVQSGNGKALR